jgi:hypothetical protein
VVCLAADVHCYVVDFFSCERVILASTDTVRIPEYQALVDQHAAAAVRLDRTPSGRSLELRSFLAPTLCAIKQG